LKQERMQETTLETLALKVITLDMKVDVPFQATLILNIATL